MNKFTIEEGELAVKIARSTIESHVKGEALPNFSVPAKFRTPGGVFVTINKYPSHELRGCIGYPEPTLPLIDALIDAAKSASTRDPRFPPVRPNELNKLVVEVSLLTPPELIKVKKEKEYIEKVKIGRDGLIVERGSFRGLLLPQVPVEWNWDVEEFLAHTCMKAGLMPDAWLQKGTKLYRFTAVIFAEETPRGKIVPKKLTR